MGKIVEEFQKRYPTKADKEKALTVMSDAQIDELIADTSNIQAKIFYNKYKKKQNNKTSEENNYWVISLGEDSYMWDTFYRDGIAAIDWHLVNTGDLKKYKSKAEIDDFGLGNHDSLCLWQFSKEIKEGDLLFVKKGLHRLLGFGIVKRSYYYANSDQYFENSLDYKHRGNYRHRVDVNWIINQETSIEKTLPRKTLTRIKQHEKDFYLNLYNLNGDILSDHILPSINITESDKETINEITGVHIKEWIVSCNPDLYDLDEAFQDLGNIEWQIGKYRIKEGDILYIYIGHTDRAIRYKCIAVSEKRMKTTIDDSAYGGNHTGTDNYPCIEIKPIGYYPGDGIKYEDLLRHGLNGAIRGPIGANGLLGEFVRSIPVRDFELKEVDDLREESWKLSETVKNLTGKDVEAVVQSRRNQGLFRKLLYDKYNGKCCLCGLEVGHLLVASHIKPWKDSDENEKVSVDNGLLLCPNHDKLFDTGDISFDENGRIMIASELSEEDCRLLNICKDMHITLSEKTKLFMKYHRENVYCTEEP